MKTNDDQIKEKLVHRLKRIEGQVRGVQTMVNEDRQCREILQQLTAIRSAVMSVSTVVLENYMSDCLLNLDDKSVQERQELMDDMIKLINKAA
ncbi:MAG: metal-sensitive transcriptional regulator [Anaerolineaceae bacterium]|nr:metal-sensitive transcriptional regulator [Anaerolineaceae bacterium]